MKLKKILAVVLTVCIVSLSFSSVFQASAQTMEYDSKQTVQMTADVDDSLQTAESPAEEINYFEINTKEDFTNFMTKSDYYKSNSVVTLKSDLDMEYGEYAPIEEFNGKFDGGRHIVSNFYIQDSHKSIKNFEFAFIKTLGSSAEFKNVTFNNYNIKDTCGFGYFPKSYTAAGFILVNHGNISGVNFTNSSAFSINDTNKIGEVAGFVLTNEKDGMITECSIDMKSQMSNINAGFVGKNSGIVSRSLANVDVTNSLYVGGFCGMNAGIISQCVSKGNVNTKTKYKTMVCGGFVGVNAGVIDNCGSMGSLCVRKVIGNVNMIAFLSVLTITIAIVAAILLVATPMILAGIAGIMSGCIAAGGVSIATASISIFEAFGGAFVGIGLGISLTCTTIILGGVLGGSKVAYEIGGAHVGGFCGDNLGAISFCNSYGSATTNANICGGFVGTNSGNIENCIATGKAKAEAKVTKVFVGGFVAENLNGTISGCESTGGAYSKSKTLCGEAKSGGFVGVNKASILKSEASGDVYLSSGSGCTDNGCGGFVGKNDKGGNIDECYAECKVETTHKKKGGGFVGEAKNKSTITKSNCKSELVTKKGTTNKIKFCQDKSKKAVIPK